MATKADDWVQVKTETSTRDLADEVARELSASGVVKFTRAQVLAAGLKIGVQAIKDNPNVLLAPVGGRRRPT